MIDYKSVEAALARHGARLMAFPNVVSVGIGYRLKGGEESEQLCISVSVERKLAESELPPGGTLPQSLDGVPVDVVETGRFEQL